MKRKVAVRAVSKLGSGKRVSFSNAALVSEHSEPTTKLKRQVIQGCIICLTLSRHFQKKSENNSMRHLHHPGFVSAGKRNTQTCHSFLDRMIPLILQGENWILPTEDGNMAPFSRIRVRTIPLKSSPRNSVKLSFFDSRNQLSP